MTLLNIRNDAKYSILVPTSMGIRMTPTNDEPVGVAKTFRLHATSAETNVVSPASFLGKPGVVLTVLRENSPIGRHIETDLRARGVHIEAKRVTIDDPWGGRHQINFADAGCGARAPRVYNDRAGELAKDYLKVEDFDLPRILGEEGAAIAHISGLIAAVSPATGQLCLEIAKAAKEYGTLVSFDLNHRATFWKGREKELHTLFTQLASLADILVGNEEDFQLCLGLEGPEAGGMGLGAKIDGFKGMISTAREQFPNTKVFATTLREVINAGEHKWGGIMYADGWHVEEPRSILVRDRIGGGDGFVGGMLYGVLKNWEPEKWLQFGWATGALAVTSNTDYAQPADEAEIWAIHEGNARVQR